MEKPIAYLGEDNYIFISYAHDDNEVVWPIIKALQTKYNVWFDEGILFGEAYKKKIIDRINNASLFIYMVSKNSLKSAFCKKEIKQAERKGVPFFVIVIEDDVLETPEAEEFLFDYEDYQMCLFFKQTMESFLDSIERLAPKIKDAKIKEKKQETPKKENKQPKQKAPKEKAKKVQEAEATSQVLKEVFDDFFGDSESSSKEKTDEEKASSQKEKSEKKAKYHIYKTVTGRFRIKYADGKEEPREFTTEKNAIKYAERVLGIPSEQSTVKIEPKKVRIDRNAAANFEIKNKRIDKYIGKNQSCVFIPKGVEAIAWIAFRDNHSEIEQLVLPSTLKRIDDEAFTQIQNLRNINVDSSNPYFCSVEGVLYSKDKTELIYYPPKKEEEAYSILKETKMIKPRAFYFSMFLKRLTIKNCENLTITRHSFYIAHIEEIEMDKGVGLIQQDALYSCHHLRTITFDGLFSEWSRIRKLGFYSAWKTSIFERKSKIQILFKDGSSHTEIVEWRK